MYIGNYTLVHCSAPNNTYCNKPFCFSDMKCSRCKTVKKVIKAEPNDSQSSPMQTQSSPIKKSKIPIAVQSPRPMRPSAQQSPIKSQQLQHSSMPSLARQSSMPSQAQHSSMPLQAQQARLQLPMRATSSTQGKEYPIQSSAQSEQQRPVSSGRLDNVVRRLSGDHLMNNDLKHMVEKAGLFSSICNVSYSILRN